MDSSRSESTVFSTSLKKTAIPRYMLRLVDPIYSKLGYESRQDDTHLDILLRKKAVRDTFTFTIHS